MMNQFECVSPVPDRTTQSATISTPSSSLSELLNMQPETQSFRSLTTHTHSFCISNANNNKNSNKNNNHRLLQRSKSLVSESFGRQRSIREGQILSVDHREVMIYDIMESGIFTSGSTTAGVGVPGGSFSKTAFSHISKSTAQIRKTAFSHISKSTAQIGSRSV
ncbi:hypothetical protein CJ030_MR2G028930 [Morella rubra]|uniref:Uncharacterized protein n=1 Tax=Morella rubra TaxID=262757 RepID=A0A6A1WDK1_9ROSI|nr:hypothetical protein CJ030_MR2G028930 [Morella rubra]